MANHEFCNECGTLMRPSARKCPACGCEGGYSDEHYLTIGDDSVVGIDAWLLSDGEPCWIDFEDEPSMT
jgi:hypothetical protein